MMRLFSDTQIQQHYYFYSEYTYDILTSTWTGNQVKIKLHKPEYYTAPRRLTKVASPDLRQGA